MIWHVFVFLSNFYPFLITEWIMGRVIYGPSVRVSIYTDIPLFALKSALRNEGIPIWAVVFTHDGGYHFSVREDDEWIVWEVLGEGIYFNWWGILSTATGTVLLWGWIYYG